MAYCRKCGAQIEDGAKFCVSCGTPAEGSASKPQQPSSNTQQTHSSAAQDAEQNKGMAVLAYLGILVLIPLLAAKESPFARFHTNQGLVLCIAAIIYGAAYSILTSVILAISWRLYFIVTLLGICGCLFAVLAIIGILNAVNGKMKDLPVIGKYRLIK